MAEPIDRLPNCNPSTHLNALICSHGAEPKTRNNEGTFHIQSKLTNGYLTYDPTTERVFANGSRLNPSYRQVWGLGWAPRHLGRTARNTETNKYFTMQGALKIRDSNPDTWEIFPFEKKPANEYIAIKNLRHGKHLTVGQDFIIRGNAASITDASLFELVKTDGGFALERLKYTDPQHLF